MMKRIALLLTPLLLAGGFLAYTGIAQPVRREVLKELRVEETGGCQRVTTELRFPFAVQGYFPPGHGALLTVRLIALETEPVSLSDLVAREALVPAANLATPLQQVSWEGDAPAGPQLVFQFDGDVAYAVTSGRDFRSVVVTLHPVTNDPAPCAGQASSAPGGAK